MAPRPPQDDPRYDYLYGSGGTSDSQGRRQPMSGNTRAGQAQQQPRIPQVQAPTGGTAPPPVPTAADPEADYRDRQIADDARLGRTMDPAMFWQQPGAYNMDAYVPEDWTFDQQQGQLVPASLPATPTVDMYLGEGWDDPDMTGWTPEQASQTKEGALLADILVGGMTPEEAIDSFIDSTDMQRITDEEGMPTGEALIRDEEGNTVDSFTEGDMTRITELAEEAMAEIGERREAMQEPRPLTEFEERGLSNPWETYPEQSFYDEGTVRQMEGAQQAAQQAAAAQAERDSIMQAASQQYMDDPGVAMQQALQQDRLAQDREAIAALNQAQQRPDPGAFWPQMASNQGQVMVGGERQDPRQVALDLATRQDPQIATAAVDARQAQADAVQRQNMAVADQQRAQFAAQMAAAQGRTPFNDQMRARQMEDMRRLGL